MLDELPPSAKLVALVLDEEGELTQTGIAEASLLATRTVRAALEQLSERDLVASRRSFVDARHHIYWLEEPPEGARRRVGGPTE